MHNKASYRYTPEDRSQEKRSYDITYEHKNAGLGSKLTSPGAKMTDDYEEGKEADSKTNDSDDEGPWSKNGDYD